MQWTVVVDGGGSGCRLGAFNDAGALCATATDGPAGLSQGIEQAWTNIQRGILQIASTLDQPLQWMPHTLCMGLAGSLRQDRQTSFLAQIPSGVKCKLVTDGHAQLVGASGGKPGVCLAVGTGSVIHWLDEAKQFGMAGGWGYPVGDEASGAWLGIQLINQYIWSRDASSAELQSSDLFTGLEQRIGTGISDIQRWTTCAQSTEMASLAPLIVEHAKDGDDIAQQLLLLGALQCDRLLSIPPEHLPLYLAGGLADTYQPILDPKFRSRLRVPEGDALSGLYLISKDTSVGSL